MEKLRKMVNQIAYTPPQDRLRTLSTLQLSFIPLLSLASTFYGFAVSLRHRLYNFGLLQKHRLAVPVISVGNLTWGGNGKTPMVEFLAVWLASAGISPLILTRGYGGADEAKMLQRHLYGTPVRIGVGANRAATASSFLKRYGYISPSKHGNVDLEKLLSENKRGNSSYSDQIGVAILDDGMQHISLWRDVEVVMVNGMVPWGNHQLIPLGPLREPLTALTRADIVVIHHADLVSDEDVEAIASEIREVKNNVLIFLTRLVPLYFFKAGNMSCKLALSNIRNNIVLCVSAIGSADSFVEKIKKMGPAYVDRLDFTDHHLFQAKDIDMIIIRLQNLQSDFAMEPVVIVTEKVSRPCKMCHFSCYFSPEKRLLHDENSGKLSASCKRTMIELLRFLSIWIHMKCWFFVPACKFCLIKEALKIALRSVCGSIWKQVTRCKYGIPLT